ncbi:MAG TPA: nucleotide exchange factor GrpE [Candidatus Omnitrophota bacterium]|nr:nucleotide exchange factor GrpE [Candidatus Omnitrophota bacterium]HPN55978.1 nucleotide exchange factor GrpE [Candidatus Omnitrophota bacterium]
MFEDKKKTQAPEDQNSAREPKPAENDPEKRAQEVKSDAVFADDGALLKAQLRETRDKYIRLCAEFDNTRKRYERERSEYVKYANERLLVDFLSVLDDLDRTVDAARAQHQDYKAFLKGVEMVMARVRDVLKNYAVKPIEAVGQKFDPHYHEILMQVESDEVEGVQVVEEFQKGYSLGDRVIRTAKVKVAVEKTARPAVSQGPSLEQVEGEDSDDNKELT